MMQSEMNVLYTVLGRYRKNTAFVDMLRISTKVIYANYSLFL